VVLSDVSIRRPVFTIILMAVLVLFGVVGLRALGLDLMPKVEAPFVSISVIYPGADPEVVENRVLEVLEDACSTISGVKKLTSSAVESYGLVFIEFELEVSADRAVQDVRDQVAKVLADLPQDAETPVIQKIDIGAAPVVALVLTGPEGALPADLTHVADKLVRAQIQRINGVGVVDILGKQEREIHIEADPRKLRAFGLSLAEVQQAVAYGNLDVPGGRLTVAGKELLLKTHGEAKTLDELRDLVLANPMGSGPIRLRDVAEVLDSTEEARTLAALDGRRGLTLYVLKQSDANSVAVAEAVMQAVAGGGIALPEGYSLKTIQTTSDFTRRSVHSVLEDLILGGALAILVILFFLRNLRATFISALALPTSVVATFAFMRLFGFTLNNITLLALSISIGMLIDDAIVVIENIHRHIEMGKEPRQAAADATAEIGLAVMATTLTIVVVFVPVALMKGIVGRIFFEFGITVAAAVLVSLFVSFTLTPMGASRLLRSHEEPGALARFVGRLLDAMDRFYRGLVGWVLSHRLLVILVGFLMLGGALAMVRYLSQEFMPKMDQGELDVTFNMPEGSSIEATFEKGEAIREVLARTDMGIQLMSVVVGAGMRKKVDEGKVFVKLPPSNQRAKSQLELAAELRGVIAEAFPGEDISVSQAATGGSGMGSEMMSKPLNVQLRGTNSNLLRESAAKLVAELRQHKGFVDLSLSDRGARPQYGFRIDRDKVSAAGLAPAQVAMFVRTAIQGAEVSQFRVGAERYKVLVKAPESYKRDRQSLLGIAIRGPAGNLLDLGELVTPFDEAAPSQIDREDRTRQVTILGNLEDLALGDAQEVVSEVAPRLLPAGVALKFAGQGQIMAESFAYMAEALILAIILIYMVLAAQFESFLHPFTIMVSLPLSLIGALLALLITRETLSIMSFIGIIMLMGLVTKNAILLVDNANQRRGQGAGVREALIEAGAVRLRPILMTTLAMIFGMLPVALALGEGSEFRAGMAITVIGGLITSTMLTLLVVPAVYSSFESARAFLTRRRKVGAQS